MPDDRGRGERVARLARELLHARADRFHDRAGDRQLIDRLTRPSVALLPVHATGVDDRFEQLFGEERIAFRTRVHRVAELFGHVDIGLARREGGADELTGLVGSEALELDLGDEPLTLELRERAEERMAPVHLIAAERRENEYARVA